MTDHDVEDSSVAKQPMEFAESYENEEQSTMVQKEKPHSGDQVWIYKNDNGRTVRSFDPPCENNLSVTIPLVASREHDGGNNTSEELEKDEVSNEAIENACRKLREIKGVEPRKRNENVRRRPISDFSALANRIGVDVGGLTDGIEQGLTEGQTFVQALQESFRSHIAADPNNPVATISNLGSILGIPVAVSVEERNGNLENANEREPRRLLSDGENVAARMMETLIAQLADPTSPSIDAETDTDNENAARSAEPNQRRNRFVVNQQPAALTDEAAMAERVASLVELGFPAGAAHAALRITGGDPDAAAAILLEQQGSE